MIIFKYYVRKIDGKLWLCCKDHNISFRTKHARRMAFRCNLALLKMWYLKLFK